MGNIERTLAATERNHAKDRIRHLRNHVIVSEFDTPLKIERDVRGNELDGSKAGALGSIKGVTAVGGHILQRRLRRDRGRSAHAAELGAFVDLRSTLLAIHDGVLSAVPLPDAT